MTRASSFPHMVAFNPPYNLGRGVRVTTPLMVVVTVAVVVLRYISCVRVF